MRLSDAGLRQRRTKALYPNHRLPPWLTEAAPRDRSNRLLDSLRRRFEDTANKTHILDPRCIERIMHSL